MVTLALVASGALLVLAVILLASQAFECYKR